MRIDTSKIVRENFLWRKHMNLPIYGEFFAKIPMESVIDFSVWVRKDGSEIFKIAEGIPYQWLLEDLKEDNKDYIDAPYKLQSEPPRGKPRGFTGSAINFSFEKLKAAQAPSPLLHACRYIS